MIVAIQVVVSNDIVMIVQSKYCPPNVLFSVIPVQPAATGSATATDICDAIVIPAFTDVVAEHVHKNPLSHGHGATDD
jgi:hypothetical protein